MLDGKRLRQALEFVVVTGFNALTLGGALVLYGRTSGLGSLGTVAASHASSAVASFLFCRFAVWRRSGRGLTRELSSAAGFFALAAVSAAASLVVTASMHAESRSPYFVLLNYGAVGVITVGKFVVQRALLTRQMVWPQALRASAGRSGV